MYLQLEFQPTPWNKTIRDSMIATFAQLQMIVGLMGKFQGVAPSEQQRQFKNIKENLLQDVRAMISKLKVGAGSSYEKFGISKNGNTRCRDLETFFSKIEEKLLHDVRTDNPKELKYPAVLFLTQDFLYALRYMDETISIKDPYEVRKINKDYVEHFVMGIVS